MGWEKKRNLCRLMACGVIIFSSLMNGTSIAQASVQTEANITQISIDDNQTLENLYEKTNLMVAIIEAYDMEEDFLKDLGLENIAGQDVAEKDMVNVSITDKIYEEPFYEITTNTFSEYMYNGEVKNNKPDDYGMLYKRDYDYGAPIIAYAGFFKEGRFDGTGIYLGDSYDPTEMYLGRFNNGEYSGNGIQISLTTSTYGNVHWVVTYGEFKEGYLNGEGKIYLDEMIAYEGKFKDGKPNGYGIQYDDAGDILYEGQWKNGKKLSSDNEKNWDSEDEHYFQDLIPEQESGESIEESIQTLDGEYESFAEEAIYGDHLTFYKEGDTLMAEVAISKNYREIVTMEGNEGISADGQEIFSIEKIDGNRIYVEYFVGSTVSKWLTKPGTSVVNYDVEVSAPDGGVNIRSGAGTEYDTLIAGMIPNGTVLNISQETSAANGNLWGYTTYEGVDGWIALSQVKTRESTTGGLLSNKISMY